MFEEKVAALQKEVAWHEEQALKYKEDIEAFNRIERMDIHRRERRLGEASCRHYLHRVMAEAAATVLAAYMGFEHTPEVVE